MSIGLHTPSRRQAALTLALLAATPPLAALAAAELSEEQQVIVEAWAMVQRGYVDQQFGGKDWKAIKSDYLKRKYTSMAQARGAVSSMLAELGDRYTRYLTPGAYEALLAKYERPADNGGIGVTVRNLPGVTPSPVEIVSVVEGAPAAAAGLRVGDIFETIDKRSLPADATADDIAGLLLGRLDEPVSLSVRRAGALQRALRRASHRASHHRASHRALRPGRAACRRRHCERHVEASRAQGRRGGGAGFHARRRQARWRAHTAHLQRGGGEWRWWRQRVWRHLRVNGASAGRGASRVGRGVAHRSTR